MRISDWSSDVCSSDLKFCARQPSVFVDDDVVFVLSLHLAIETRGDRADTRDIADVEAGDLVAGLVRGAGVVGISKAGQRVTDGFQAVRPVVTAELQRPVQTDFKTRRRSEIETNTDALGMIEIAPLEV